jgi:hypothetical protein
MDDVDKIYNDATQKGLELTRKLLREAPNYVEPTAITLGAAVGSLFGSVYSAATQDAKDNAKKWIEAFFLTMTGGLKKTMNIDMSVNWVIKEPKKEE